MGNGFGDGWWMIIALTFVGAATIIGGGLWLAWIFLAWLVGG